MRLISPWDDAHRQAARVALHPDGHRVPVSQPHRIPRLHPHPSVRLADPQFL